MPINELPIYGGRIQSTKEVWMDRLVLSDDMKSVAFDGVHAGEDEPRIYCENDHTHEEMRERNSLCTRDELRQQLDAAIEGDSPRSAIHIQDVLAGVEDPDEWLVLEIRKIRAWALEGDD